MTMTTPTSTTAILMGMEMLTGFTGQQRELSHFQIRHVDVIPIGGPGTEGFLTDRMNFVKGQAGQRLTDLDLAFAIFQVSCPFDRDDLAARRVEPSRSYRGMLGSGAGSAR